MNDPTPPLVTLANDGGDDTARWLIAAAAPLLTEGTPRNFAELLFGRAAPEDLVASSSRDIAQLAQDAWEFLSTRKPGCLKIRLQAPHGGDRLGDISVVEMINDDKPFLLDSTMGTLAELGVAVRLVAHPVLGVTRNPDGSLAKLDPAGTRESFIHIHIDRIDEEDRKTRILSALGDTLTEGHLAVAGWRPMLDRAAAVIKDLKANPPPLPPAEVSEAIEFLEWLLVDNFTFLGVREDSYDA